MDLLIVDLFRFSTRINHLFINCLSSYSGKQFFVLVVRYNNCAMQSGDTFYYIVHRTCMVCGLYTIPLVHNCVYIAQDMAHIDLSIVQCTSKHKILSNRTHIMMIIQFISYRLAQAGFFLYCVLIIKIAN